MLLTILEKPEQERDQCISFLFIFFSFPFSVIFSQRSLEAINESLCRFPEIVWQKMKKERSIEKPRRY